MSTIIEDFLKHYEQKYDFYQKLSQNTASLIEKELKEGGIKAIISNRAKSIERLGEKIKNRDRQITYQSEADILNDIHDLAGVRVALYFPSDRLYVQKTIEKLFNISQHKVFPIKATQEYKSKLTQKFSGYAADHYRVTLSETSTESRFLNNKVEIQVASVLMHAWSEVEHDLVYKPFSGDLTLTELALLDQINGLVLTGEIALELLQKAMAERTSNQLQQSTKSQPSRELLSNFIRSRLTDEQRKGMRIGNIFLLDLFFQSLTSINFKILDNYINKLNHNSTEDIAEQLLNMVLLHQNIESSEIESYFKKLDFSPSKSQDGAMFITFCTLTEKIIRDLFKDIIGEKSVFQTMQFILTQNIPNVEESVGDLKHYWYLRRSALFATDTVPQSEFLAGIRYLKDRIPKFIDLLRNTSTKAKFRKEYEKITKI
ncbi:RelA/SpoT domain-containing protein [Xanthocytophaga flava]|uniref:RelA/SpoT domain-containing protein n=1 Tax=Xanthocytophaga flava TaxID=3048013 RepID=UPI0028D36F72|nr:RelA/SpoT domain-containing protein [Xanthocytophaga flavus]MDJ1473378.1 RelA/SpoT domain-containing protein [Xanthocytophaga flavus]